ncbi:MAG TPA: pyruvate ferredoxin oxidoreductase [Thermoanaerobaculia bacterium]|nr:pyruvate ferredoxin oxidoreductase [Thermoanaerobaculia bacterium]
MARTLCTGNYAAGHTLAKAGEANRGARGCAGGAYPITPQTEIIEYLRGFDFSKGRIVPVESEHSAMGVCIGAAMSGARAFTASSSNGLAYMTENVFAAGYYRLPIVLIAVNRTLGPPWNIWVDQGDSLALRDAAWLQFYCDTHQDLVDTILVAFRVAEDSRVLLPAIVAMDGFVTSHTQMVVDLPEQQLVDQYLPPCWVPQRLRHDRPATFGGLTWPRETERHRKEIQDAMDRVPEAMADAVEEFAHLFGRRPDGAIVAEQTSDAETVLIATNTMAATLRNVVRERRARGERVGMIRIKQFRPFPREELIRAIGPAKKVGVLDRNHAPGSGGIFWGEVAATLRGSEVLLQDYIVGIGGGDVTPATLAAIADDLSARTKAEAPQWREVSA